MSGKQALIIIDVQYAFLDKKWGHRNNPNAELNIKKYWTLQERIIGQLFLFSMFPMSQTLFFIKKDTV